MAYEQAMRFNTDKAILSFLLDFPHAGEGVCRVLEFGMKKYSRNNWKKGLVYSEIMDSMLRHLTAFKNGEVLDEDSGLPHVDHVACNALFLSEMTRIGKQFDDRHGECKAHKKAKTHKELFYMKSGQMLPAVEKKGVMYLIAPEYYIPEDGETWTLWNHGDILSEKLVLTQGAIKSSINGCHVHAVKFKNGAVWDFITGWRK